jgi:hypothetical protein
MAMNPWLKWRDAEWWPKGVSDSCKHDCDKAMLCYAAEGWLMERGWVLSHCDEWQISRSDGHGGYNMHKYNPDRESLILAALAEEAK